jgi:hypothetical protein
MPDAAHPEGKGVTLHTPRRLHEHRPQHTEIADQHQPLEDSSAFGNIYCIAPDISGLRPHALPALGHAEVTSWLVVPNRTQWTR